MKRSVPRVHGAARELAKAELIGRECEIAQSSDPGIIGLSGEVVDETLKTLVLRVGGPGGRRVRVSKVGNTFQFTVEGSLVDVDGAAIEFRPEDRTKKVR